MNKVSKLRPDGTPILEGFFVLSEHPVDGGFVSEVENSFSLSTSHDRAQFHWSSEYATSNLGGCFQIDGRETAERAKRRLETQFPQGLAFRVWEVHDPELPIAPDWRAWEAASQPSERTWSGVVDKFGARNVSYEMKEEVKR